MEITNSAETWVNFKLKTHTGVCVCVGVCGVCGCGVCVTIAVHRGVTFVDLVKSLTKTPYINT